MPRIVPKLLTIGLLFLFTGSFFLNIAPRNSLALDPFEPNNSLDFVTVLHKENYTGLSLYPNDYDYYCVFLAAGENMSVVVWDYTITPTLRLRDPVTSGYAYSVTEGSTLKALVLPALHAGYYYIEVSSGSSTDYCLNITDIEAPGDDPLEPNDDFGSAQELVVGESYTNLSLWDVDYYKVDLAAGANLSITMNQTGWSSNSFDATLYAPDNTTLLDSTTVSSSGTTSELVLVNASVAGTYFLKVSYQLGAWGNYSIAVQPEGDDIYEPNDDFSTAAVLDTNVGYSKLYLYGADFYNVSLAAGDDVLIYLIRDGGVGSFWLSCYRPDQSLIASGPLRFGLFAYQSILNVPATGVYTIKVNGTTGTRGNYSLAIMILSDDMYDIPEANNAFEDATSITKYALYDNLAYLDEDFYNLTLAEGDNLSVCLTAYSVFPDSEGLRSLSIYAPDQSTLISTGLASTGSNNEVAMLHAPSSGSYYIRVNGSATSWGNYSLLTRDVSDDIYEDNDAFETAPFLAKNAEYPNLALLDDDYFNVTLTEGENLSVRLVRVKGDSTFNLSLIAPDQVTILQSVEIAAESSGQLALMAAGTAGTYHLRVHRLDDYMQNYLGNYSLSIYNICDDPLEENDVLGTGPYVPKGTTYSNLALIDDDYYNISLQVGDNLSILVTRPIYYPMSIINPLAGEFFIHLFDPDYVLLQSQPVDYDILYLYEYNTPFAAEILLPNVVEAGTYYLLVNKTTDASGNYSLTVRDLPDDSLEPSDTIGGAAAVSKGDHYEDLQLYDDDFYSITLPPGPSSSNLSIIVTRITPYEFFDLYLLDTDGTTILQMLNMTGKLNANMVALSLVPGTYYLKVNGTCGSHKNYSLTFRDAFDDAYEMNNDVGSARELANGSAYTDLYFKDVDYYNVSLIAGGDFAATLYRAGGGGTFNLTLFGPDGSLVSTTTLFDNNPKSVFLTDLPLGGNYTLLVNASEGAWGHYSLLLGNVLDDAFEDNDDFAHAPGLVFGKTYSNLQLYDADFFSYDATAGETFGVLLRGPSDPNFFFNLTIFAPDQVTIMCQGTYSYFSSSFPMYLVVSNAAGGTYYLKVNATKSVYAPYSLCIQELSAEPFEDNDNAGQATPINGALTQMWGYTFDEDWYKFSLPGNSTVWLLCLCWDKVAGFSADLLASDGTTLLPLTALPESPLSPFNLFGSWYYSNYVDGEFYYRVRSAPGRAVYYMFLSLCLNVSQPADITCYEGSAGNTITWTLQDSYFATPNNTATVFRNGTPILSQGWGPTGIVTVSADGLDPGTYEFTLAAVTYLGLPRNDTVIVMVLPTFSLSSAPDVSFVFGSPLPITWDVEAIFVGMTPSYTIKSSETPLDSGFWEWPEDTISYTPSTLDVGTHMLVLNVTDGMGNWTIDEIEVTVLNLFTITTPADLTFTAGTTGNRLSWTPTAAQIGTTSYNILVNGAIVATGTWTNRTVISYALDSLSPGAYNVTIIVWDGLGTTRQDEVAVTVVGGFPMEVVFIIVGAGVGFALGAVYFVRRRKRRAFYPV